MIKSNTFLSALPLSEKYAESGKTLVAKPNTVLSILVEKSVPIFTSVAENREQLEGFGEILESTSVGTLEQPSSHSLELDAIIKDISKAVTAHISFAKNTVKPLVLEFAAAIQEYKETNVLKDAGEKFNIIVLNIPGVLQSEMFLDTLSFYKGKSVLEPDLSFSLEVKDRDQLVALMLTGHSDTDKLIVEWASHLEDGFLVNLWNSLFTTLATSGKTIKFNSISQLNAYEKADYATAIYLLSRKLFDQVDGSTKEVSLSVYKNTAAQIRDYAGALLVEAINKMALFNKSKLLVIESFPELYSAKVNGAVYKQWLETGGSPEVILGLIISGKNISSQVLIDQQAKDLVAQWNSFCSFYKTNESNKAFQYYSEFLISSFFGSLRDKKDSEIDYIESHANYYDTANKLAYEEIRKLKTDDMSDYFGVALTLVAKCRFYYTSSYNILSDITEAGKVNPNVDIREAALLAVVNYVADYVADQIAVIS